MGVVVAEPKPTAASFRNRRLQKRYPLPADAGATLKFCHPGAGGPAFTASVRDVSLSGLSFILPSEIPGLHVGEIVRGMEAVIAGRSFRGDLLAMHLTPGNFGGSACGGLFYPESDEDLITIRLVVRALEHSS
jgi:hypothetical protein